MDGHDTIIYVIVGIIICVQLFFFIKNLTKILAYKNMIARNTELSIVELDVDQDDIATKSPEYLLKNLKEHPTEEIEYIKTYIDDDLSENLDEASENEEKDRKSTRLNSSHVRISYA